MEQSVALRKLEEKLKLTERQLLDYQVSPLVKPGQSIRRVLIRIWVIRA